MMPIIITSLILLIVLMALLAWGRLNWSQYTSRLSEKLISDSVNSDQHVNLDEVALLPDPVKRYFHHVLKNGQPIINRAHISQIGGFRAKPEMTEWSEMKADQHFSATPKAFVWNSHISILPMLSINVCDAYTNGKGKMKGKLISLITLIDAHDEEELNQGALQRYLAEAVWFPTSLLPSQGVTWEEINHSQAKATLSDSGITVSLEFEFNEKGEAVSVYTPARYREVAGHYELTPWKGTFTEYIDAGGYRIPSEGKVEWHLKDKKYPYWRAKIVDVSYE